jgi:hypothetical protein
MSTSITINPVVPTVPLPLGPAQSAADRAERLPPALPLVVLEPEHDATTRAVPPTPVETEPPKPVESEPSQSQLKVNAAVASHFIPEEMRAASAWQAQHPEIPGIENWLKVFPDPVINKIHVELKRVSDRRSGRVPNDADVEEREPFADPDEQTAEERAELEEPEDDDGESRDDYDALIDSAADGMDLSDEIWDRLKAAEHKPRHDRSPDRFMARLDGFIEPYLAVQRGMSLGEAARKFNVAHIQQRMERVEMWLSLCEQLPRFKRATFLNRLERAVEKRRQDAAIGAERADAQREAFTKPPEEESPEKRGAEWATINHIPRVDRKTRKPEPKRDLPWSGAPAQPYHRSVWTTAADARDQMGEQQPAEPKLPLTIAISPSRKEQRKRQLEDGLLIILDTMPPGAHRVELVDVVDLRVAGVGISTRTVKRRLDEVTKAACHKTRNSKKTLSPAES